MAITAAVLYELPEGDANKGAIAFYDGYIAFLSRKAGGGYPFVNLLDRLGNRLEEIDLRQHAGHGAEAQGLALGPAPGRTLGIVVLCLAGNGVARPHVVRLWTDYSLVEAEPAPPR